MHWKNRQAGWQRQKGMTLMELLVAGAISIIVTSGMVILMASTLGTGTQTIKMTRLAGEMRSAMQIMTRELRRANHHATYASCFGDQNCIVTLDALTPGFITKVTEINIGEINDPGDCVWFWYDRPQRCESPPCTADELAVDQDQIIDEAVAAFRRMVNEEGIGILQMAATAETSVSCGDDLTDSDWADITNSELIDVQEFEVSDAVTDFESYVFTINGTQSVERIGITMRGRLIDQGALPTWMQEGTSVNPKLLTLTLEDFVRVRNDIVRP